MSLHLSPLNLKQKIEQITEQKKLLNDFFKLKRIKFGQYSTFHEKTVYEQDLAQPITWQNPEGITTTLQGNKIFNRKAIFQFIRQKILNNSKTKIINSDAKFILIDINNFHATNIPDENGVLGGDFILNQLSKALMNLTKEYLAHLATKGVLKATIRFGRYGGDEFLFYFSGEVTHNNIEDFYAKICKRLEGIATFYDFRGKITKRPLKLKKNIEIITIPNNQTEQSIFLHYLYKNLILTPKDISLAKKTQPSNKEALGIKLLSHEEKHEAISALKKHHPDLNTLIEQGLQIDEAEQKNFYLDNFAEFYVQMLQDPLFDRIIFSQAEFIHQIATHELSHVLVFDIKFIKELNDCYGVATGDSFIVQALHQILSKFDPVDHEDLIIGRRGGTIYMGISDLRKFQLKSILFLQLFSKKPYLNITLHSKSITIPVGYIKIRLSPNDSSLFPQTVDSEKYEKVLFMTKNIITKGMDACKIKLYQELGSIIKPNPVLLTNLIQRFSYLQNDIIALKPEALENLTIEELIILFLTGNKLISNKEPISERYLSRFEKLITLNNGLLTKGQIVILTRLFNGLYKQAINLEEASTLTQRS